MITFLLASLLNRSDLQNVPQLNSPNKKTIQSGLDIVYEIVGALAFLMILIAALRYVINSDDPNKITEAKNTIIYTFVGLLVIILAATIVNYVLNV